MDMPADFTLKSTLPPFSGKGAETSIWTIPGYQSGQRVASLKSRMVSNGGALMWTSRCTIAIGDLLERIDDARWAVVNLRPGHPAKSSRALVLLVQLATVGDAPLLLLP